MLLFLHSFIAWPQQCKKLVNNVFPNNQASFSLKWLSVYRSLNCFFFCLHDLYRLLIKMCLSTNWPICSLCVSSSSFQSGNNINHFFLNLKNRSILLKFKRPHMSKMYLWFGRVLSDQRKMAFLFAIVKVLVRLNMEKSFQAKQREMETARPCTRKETLTVQVVMNAGWPSLNRSLRAGEGLLGYQLQSEMKIYSPLHGEGSEDQKQAKRKVMKRV